MNWRAIGNLRALSNWRAIGIAGFLAAMTTVSSLGHADDPRGQQTALEKEIATLNQQISGKQQQITSLRNRPSPEQAELAAAQKALNDAKAQLKTEPSPDNEGKVRNTQFKLKLAEIKYDKAHGDVEALSDEVDRLKQQVAAKQQQIKELARQGNDQADQQQQKLADERAKRQQQEQELARTRQEADAAQKEIERLKAALAAKETAEAKAAVAKAAAPAPAPTPVVAPSPVPVAAAAPAPKAVAAAVTDSAMTKLTSQQQVLTELQAMAQRAAAGGSGRGTNRVLYLKQPGTTASNKDKVGLRAIGNEQYRGTFNVKPGNYEAVVGFNNWPVQFAADEEGENVFLLDYSDEKAPHLKIYNSRLEGGK